MQVWIFSLESLLSRLCLYTKILIKICIKSNIYAFNFYRDGRAEECYCVPVGQCPTQSIMASNSGFQDYSALVDPRTLPSEIDSILEAEQIGKSYVYCTIGVQSAIMQLSPLRKCL